MQIDTRKRLYPPLDLTLRCSCLSSASPQLLDRQSMESGSPDAKGGRVKTRDDRLHRVARGWPSCVLTELFLYLVRM